MNFKTMLTRTRVPSDAGGISRTKQSEEPATNINRIVERYMRTRDENILNPLGRKLNFADVTGMDYMEMRNAIADIGNEFQRLPSKVRKLFDNDAYQMLRWLEDPRNTEKAMELGLIPDPEADARRAAEAIVRPQAEPQQLTIEDVRKAITEAGNVSKPAGEKPAAQ